MNVQEWKDFSEKYIITKKEAQKILKMSNSAMNQALATGRLTPIFERGEGTGKVRLFYRPHVEEYLKEVEERRKRLKKS